MKMKGKPGGQDADVPRDLQQKLQQALGAAVQDLVAYTGSEGFFASFTTDTDETYYLVFGQLPTLQAFVAMRQDAGADPDTPAIH